jgi:feruloyl esterase
LVPGSELGWAAQAGPQLAGPPNGHFKYVVFKDPNWDYRTFNFDSDMALADEIDNGTLSATDPDLNAFFAHGGNSCNTMVGATTNSLHSIASITIEAF